MKTFFTLPVVLAAVALSLGVGCTKKRDAKLADGDGRYSDAVSKYEGKVFPVQTLGAKGTKGAIITSSENFSINTSDNSGVIKSFPVVDFKTDAELAKDIPLLAKENTTGVYEIHYSLTNTHLVVSKVAKEEFIPFQEKTYAQKLSDGRLSVPLIGYPIIGKVSREVAKNDLGERTSRLVERPVLDIAQASHVQIDFTRSEEFGALKKIDTFPVNYFTGNNNEYEWYYGETVLGTPDMIADSIGDSSTFTLFDVRQSLVKFERTQNGLEVVGLALDDKGKGNKSNYKRVAFIPGEYREFIVEKDGRFRRMKEEIETSDKVHWSKTAYIKMNFSGLISESASGGSYADHFGGRGNGSNVINSGQLKVANITLENDFISIILENTKNNIRYNVAFLKKKKDNYKPLYYHEVDNRLFGFYATARPALETNDLRSRRQDDLEKLYVVNRFNPAKKTITYHLSKSTPDWSIPGAKMAIDSWNKAFAEANTGIEVKLGDFKVETGDIRYNVITMIDSKGAGGSSGLFGYGPVLSDPNTGEVVSATSTIHLQTMRNSISGDIRSYLLSKTGVLPEFYGKTSGGLEGILTSVADTMSKLSTSLMKNEEKQTDADKTPSKLNLNVKNYKSPSESFDRISRYTSNDFRQKYARLGKESAVPVLMGNVENDLQQKCPEVLSYIQELKSKNQKYDDREVSIIENCADKIIVTALVPTLVHELGHNFGLRHNYAGSADNMNFERDANGNYTTNTASIMDYVPVEYRKLMKPGAYDIAAIQYAYAGQVRLKGTSQVIELKDPNQNIQKNLAAYGRNLSDLKPYKYCTDFEAKSGHNDPLCELFDIGWEPEQAVDFWIGEAHKTFALGQYKFDRARTRTHDDQANYFASRLMPLMKFYIHWREKLAEFMGKNQLYLERMTQEQYQDVLKRMSEDPAYSAFVKTYQPLSNKIFNFLASYAFLPDYYCVVEKNDGKSMDVIEFNKVRSDVYAKSKESIRSCDDSRANSVYAALNSKYVTEFGYSSRDIIFDMSDMGQVNSVVGYTQPDILSSEPIKDMASLFVTQRLMGTQKGWQMGQIPSMLDEPHYRNYWLERSFQRVLFGLNPQMLLSQSPDLTRKLTALNLIDKFKASKLSPSFAEEMNILKKQMFYIKRGLQVPNSLNDTFERMKLIQGSIVQGGGAQILEGVSYASGAEAIYNSEAVKKVMANKGAMDANTESLNMIVQVIREMKLPETSEELAKLSIKEIIQKMNMMNQVLQKIAAADQAAAQKFIQDVLASFPDIGNLANDIAKAQENFKGKSEKEIEEMVSQSASTVLETFKPFKLEEKLAELNTVAEQVKRNESEFRAQQTILTEFLIFN